MSRISSLFPLALVLPAAILLAPRPAAAAEVIWDGYYRAEGHVYSSLSLSKTNPLAEGTSAWMDHRARLRPGFLFSDKVALYTQLDLLPFVMFGQDPAGGIDLTTGSDLPLVYDQAVQPPTTTDGAVTLQNLQVTRLWGEVYFDNIGTLRFGRMPVEWGSGMVFNAGNRPEDDAGDTEDRVSFTGRAGPIYVMGAFGVPDGGFVNQFDGMRDLSGSVAHLSEQASVGFYNSYRWQNSDTSKVGVWTGDLWGKAELGPVRVETELAAVIGSGDLDTGANGVSIAAFGGHINGLFDSDHLIFGLDAGLAGGDKDTEDKKLHTFAFDSDYNLSLMMFEQPMPVLQATVSNDTNNGRNLGAVRTRNGLSNAAYIRPMVGWKLRPDLTAQASLLAAQAAKLPDADKANKGYGTELDLDLGYRPFDHFQVGLTGGAFFPGKYYSGYEDATLGSGFDHMALGTRVRATVQF